MAIANDSGQPVEQELADIIVILNVSTPQQVRDALDGLRSAGLTVMKVDEENGVVEGVADPKALAQLRRLATVGNARLRFAYIAEAPAQNDGD